MEENDVDIAISQNGLLNVTIECGSIRDILFEMQNRIGRLTQQVNESLKSRELEAIQQQIENLESRIDEINTIPEVQHEETPQSTQDISEEMEKKLEEMRRGLIKTIEENKFDATGLKGEITQTIESLKADVAAETSSKYATIESLEKMKSTMTDDAEKNKSTGLTKLRLMPNVPEAKLSGRSSGHGNIASFKAMTEVSDRIKKVSTTVQDLQTKFDELDKKQTALSEQVKQVEENQGEKATSTRSWTDSVTRVEERLAELETGKATVSIDTEALKSEIMNSIMQELVPSLKKQIIDEVSSSLVIPAPIASEIEPEKTPISRPRTADNERFEALERRLEDLEQRFNEVTQSMAYKISLMQQDILKMEAPVAVVERKLPNDVVQDSEETEEIMCCSVGVQTCEEEAVQVMPMNDITTSPLISRPDSPKVVMQVSAPTNYSRAGTPMGSARSMPRDDALESAPVTPELSPLPTKQSPFTPPKSPVSVSRPFSAPRGTRSGNSSARSHFQGQTYEELDALTKLLKERMDEAFQQLGTINDRLGESDRSMRQMNKQMELQATKDALDQLRIELDERTAFGQKSSRDEVVYAPQLKRVVSNFQGSMKTVDKQITALQELVPTFVSRSELEELMESVANACRTHGESDLQSTAAGRLSYKCLMCGRPTNNVTGMITETEVAKLIGEPPICGVEKAGNDFVLVYGREGAYRAASPTGKKKPTSALPRIGTAKTGSRPQTSLQNSQNV